MKLKVQILKVQILLSQKGLSCNKAYLYMVREWKVNFAKYPKKMKQVIGVNDT